jgi:MFS family permease
LIDKLAKRVSIIWISSLLTSLVTLGFLFFNEIVYLFPIAFLLGIVAGINLPAIGTFFADHTYQDDRGRILGVSLGLSMPLAFFFLLSNELVQLSVNQEIIIVSGIILLSLVSIIMKPADAKIKKPSRRRRRSPNYKQILYFASPVFLFYWVAGVLLSIVFPTILDHVSGLTFFLIWSLPFLIGGVLAGVMFDSMGRNFPTIVGLALTGVSLAVFGVLGIRSGYILIVPLAVGFSIATVFSLIVWAELAPEHSRGTYYGVGVAIISLALLLGLFSAGSIFGSISASRIKSYIMFASVALFLGIPPLIMAEELLPKELIEQRQFQEYIEQAKKKYIK